MFLRYIGFSSFWLLFHRGSSQIDQFHKNTGVISSSERTCDIAGYLLADKGYDSDTIIKKRQGRNDTIPPLSSESSFLLVIMAVIYTSYTS